MWSSLTEYHRPASIAQALRLLARPAPRTVPLAGGAWLVATRDPTVEAVVDLGGLNLSFIQQRGRRLRLGAMTTLQTLIDHPQLSNLAGGLLAEAARQLAPAALRHVATLGGSLVAGRSTSELALALLALDAQVVIRAPDRRVISLEAFLANRVEHLPSTGLIIELNLPLPPVNAAANLVKISRTPRSRPIVNAAALVVRQGHVCTSARLVLGGVAPYPIRLPAVAAMLSGRTPDEALLANVAQYISAAITPTGDQLASAEYRREMAGVVALRALGQAWEQIE